MSNNTYSRVKDNATATSNIELLSRSKTHPRADDELLRQESSTYSKFEMSNSTVMTRVNGGRPENTDLDLRGIEVRRDLKISSSKR
jgi:hypothetical protein